MVSNDELECINLDSTVGKDIRRREKLRERVVGL